MLVAGGSLFLYWGWRLNRIDARMKEVLANIDGTGLVAFPSGEKRLEVEQLLARKGRRHGIGWSVGVDAVVATVVWYLPHDDALSRVLAAVLLVCGAVLGYRVGQLRVNGSALEIISQQGLEIYSGGDRGAHAIKPFRDLFGLALQVGLTICLWHNFWLLAWSLGLRTSDQWRLPYMLTWVVSIAILLTIGLLPVRTFNRRLNIIYGGPEARRRFAQQRDLAQDDLAQLDTRIEELTSRNESRAMLRQLQHERAELDAYVQGLADRTVGDWLMRPLVIIGAALGSTALLVLAIVIEFTR
jgi:hypothetical protein